MLPGREVGLLQIFGGTSLGGAGRVRHLKADSQAVVQSCCALAKSSCLKSEPRWLLRLQRRCIPVLAVCSWERKADTFFLGKVKDSYPPSFV